MEALRADWRESLARFEAEGAKAREASAKQRAAEREADAKQRAEDRAALARAEAASKEAAAENRAATQKLRTEMYASVAVIIGTTLTAIAVGVAVLGIWLQILLQPGS